MKLCCTSVMLPRWSLDDTFDNLAEYGYDAVELRCRFNPDESDSEPSFWGRHLSDVSPDNVVEKAKAIREASQRSGVRVAALAPNCLLTDTDTVLKIFRGALAIDPDSPPMIRIGAPRQDRNRPYVPQFLAARSGYAGLVEIAREYGVKILYEIHVGTVAVSAARTIELLRDLDPDHIGAIYDVPNMLRVGLEDSLMGMELLGPYLAHCHMGNGIPVPGERDGHGVIPYQWAFRGLKDGIANVAQIVGDLRSTGYIGHISLEDFGPGEDSDKVRDQGAYLHSLMNDSHDD
ncbi:MAG: sugar phosphate isomerase/epimerase [Candidatus Latescibacteria bacterium]|jgi:sugar phosphate isomerase/epimerase|nr:sugar phosphate isomerase/epimerase [Candidatus Latescibacterota bacterium]